MSFLSQAWMLDKYGPRLAMKDLADTRTDRGCRDIIRLERANAGANDR